MFLTNDDCVLYTSASDLSSASKCEFAFLRGLDARLGRSTAIEVTPDAMLERTGELGNEHEDRVLAKYRRDTRVVEIDRPNARDADELDAAAAATVAAFRD